MWTMDNSNSACNQFEQFNKHKEHLEKLLLIKGRIDNKIPFYPNFFNFKSSKLHSEKEKQKRINYNNSILFNNMSKIASTPSPYSLSVSQPKYCAAFDKTRFNCSMYNSAVRDKANSNYIQRCIKTKAHYSYEKYLKDADYRKYLQRNISRKNINPNLSFVPFCRFKQRFIGEMNKRKSQVMARSKSFQLRPWSASALFLKTPSLSNTNNEKIKSYFNQSKMTNRSTSYQSVTSS